MAREGMFTVSFNNDVREVYERVRKAVGDELDMRPTHSLVLAYLCQMAGEYYANKELNDLVKTLNTNKYPGPNL